MSLRLQNVWFQYGGFGREEPSSDESSSGEFQNGRFALRDINLDIEPGEFIGIVGRSGSGKTTLVQLFNGLLKPTKGCVYWKGQDIFSHSNLLRRIRVTIGLVFQFPETQFFEDTVFAEVSYGPRNLEWSEAMVSKRVQDALSLVDLDPSTFLGRSPFQLSEGEKRRVAIASLLAMDPEYLVLDEPTAGLDYRSVERLKACMKRIHARGKTVILVSHDMELVAELVQRVIALRRGRIIYDGLKEPFFHNSEFLRQLGLRAPAAAQLAQKLRQKGLPISPLPLTRSQLRNRLRHLACNRQ